MTQLAAPTRAPRRTAPSRPRAARTSRPSTRVTARGASSATRVAVARRTGHSAFMALVIVVALTSALALLFLNTMRAEQSFTVSTLRSDVATLNDREQALNSEISAVSAPEELTMKADGYGMVKAASVTYVDKVTGKKIGVARPKNAGTGLSVNTLADTPPSKAANEVLASGTIGLHVTDPVARAQAAAAAKAKADAAEKADAAKKAAEAKKTSK